MAGKVCVTSWSGSLQLTPTLVTCHTPLIVGAWFSPESLHTSKLLAATARVATAICIFNFIFHSFCLLFFLRLGRTGNCGHQGHVLSRHSLYFVSTFPKENTRQDFKKSEKKFLNRNIASLWE
jgi:hypothetical protein